MNLENLKEDSGVRDKMRAFRRKDQGDKEFKGKTRMKGCRDELSKQEKANYSHFILEGFIYCIQVLNYYTVSHKFVYSNNNFKNHRHILKRKKKVLEDLISPNFLLSNFS